MGSPMIMTGTAMPATREITIGAPSTMPSCHRIFRVLDQGLLPQKVHPDGLQGQHEAGPTAHAQGQADNGTVALQSSRKPSFPTPPWTPGKPAAVLHPCYLAERGRGSLQDPTAPTTPDGTPKSHHNPQPCTDLRKCTSEISCRQSQQNRQPHTVQFMRLQLPSLIFIMKALQRGQTLMSSASAGREKADELGLRRGQDTAALPQLPP